MKTTVQNLDPSRIKLTVEVPYEELKPSLDAAYKEIGSQIQVPGFRAGKVPARIIEQRVGKGAVIQEAVNEALPEFFGKAVDEMSDAPTSYGAPIDPTDPGAESPATEETAEAAPVEGGEVEIGTDITAAVSVAEAYRNARRK